VSAGVVATSDDVERYLKCSLMAATQDYQQVAAASTLEALKWLCKNEFIKCVLLLCAYRHMPCYEHNLHPAASDAANSLTLAATGWNMCWTACVKCW
jgi:hypothetical protein